MLVPSADLFPSQRVGRWVLLVEVELARTGFGEQFACSVPQKLVHCGRDVLDATGALFEAILLRQVYIGKWARQVVLCADSVSNNQILAAMHLSDIVVVG